MSRSVVSPSWADLVFHVFAHIPVPSAVPASLHDPDYVAFVAAHVGGLSARPHGRDLTQLARLLADHGRLARVEALAGLFEGWPALTGAGDRPLAELPQLAGEVPGIRQVLLADATVAEILWATVLLERPAYARLPAAALDTAAFDRLVAERVAVAPQLGACRIQHARALGPHGRVFGGRIWLGLPTDPEHTAWQAAHEATVCEVQRAVASEAKALALMNEAKAFALTSEATALTERQIEGVAVALLAARSRRAGEGAGHQRWGRRWGLTPEHCDPARLAPRQRALFDALLG